MIGPAANLRGFAADVFRGVARGAPSRAASRAFGLALLVAMGLVARANAQVCGPTDGIAIAKTADLNFGSLVAGPSAGTVVIDPATGVRTSSGGVFLAGATANPAGFSVLICAPAGPKRFTVVLPAAAVLTRSGGGTMTADTFTQNPANPIPGSQTTPTPFTVGATLHVGANQLTGDYTGVFTVMVVRQ